MAVTRRQVGFDARLAGHSHAGIGRYAEELLHHWLEQTAAPVKKQAAETADIPVNWHVFTRSSTDLSWLADYNHVTHHVTDIQHYTLAEQIRWWQLLQRAELDWLHVPHFNVPLLYRGPYSVTIHDLLWHEKRDSQATTLPTWQHTIKYGAYRAVSNHAMRRARLILVPSQVVAHQVHQYTGDTTPVVVTPEGVGDVFRATNLLTAVPVRSRQSPYVIFTGSLYPHKNLSVVLRALRQLPGWRLKLAGVRNVFSEQTLAMAQRLSVATQIDWLGYVPDEELVTLYQKAIAVLQPSTSEGFGLTGLEALATGATVVCSDLPIFREVYGDHAYRFAPYDALSLVNILLELENQPPTLAQRVAQQRYARLFTWNKMAEKSWQALQKVWAVHFSV